MVPVFSGQVAAGRKMTRDEVHTLAQGRVWTGRQALENGLVDALGSLADAVEVARIKAGLTDEDRWELWESPEPPDFFEALTGGEIKVSSLLSSAFGFNAGTEALILDSMPQLRRALGNLFTFVKTAGEEKFLYMMPMDFHAN